MDIKTICLTHFKFVQSRNLCGDCTFCSCLLVEVLKKFGHTNVKTISVGVVVYGAKFVAWEQENDRFPTIEECSEFGLGAAGLGKVDDASSDIFHVAVIATDTDGKMFLADASLPQVNDKHSDFDFPSIFVPIEPEFAKGKESKLFNVRGGFLKYIAHPDHQPDYDTDKIGAALAEKADEIEQRLIKGL